MSAEFPDSQTKSHSAAIFHSRRPRIFSRWLTRFSRKIYCVASRRKAKIIFLSIHSDNITWPRSGGKFAHFLGWKTENLTSVFYFLGSGELQIVLGQPVLRRRWRVLWRHEQDQEPDHWVQQTEAIYHRARIRAEANCTFAKWEQAAAPSVECGDHYRITRKGHGSECAGPGQVWDRGSSAESHALTHHRSEDGRDLLERTQNNHAVPQQDSQLFLPTFRRHQYSVTSHS